MEPKDIINIAPIICGRSRCDESFIRDKKVPAPPTIEELPEKDRHRNWIGPEIKVGGTFLKTQSNRALSNIKYECFDEGEPAEYEKEK